MDVTRTSLFDPSVLLHIANQQQTNSMDLPGSFLMMFPIESIVGPFDNECGFPYEMSEMEGQGQTESSLFIRGSPASEPESNDSNVDSPPAQDEDTISPQAFSSVQPWFTLPSYRYKLKAAKKSKEDRHEVTVQAPASSNMSGVNTSFITSSNAPSVFGKLKESLDQPFKKSRLDSGNELRIEPPCAVDYDLQRIQDRASRSQNGCSYMLPVQMMLHICTFLTVPELGVVSRTCLYFNSIIEEYKRNNELILWAAIVDACGSKYLEPQEEMEQEKSDQELKAKIMQSIQPKDWQVKFRVDDLKRELVKRGVNREVVAKLKLKTDLQARLSSLLEAECFQIFSAQKQIGFDILPDNVYFHTLPPASISYPRNRANIVIRVVWTKDYTDTKNPFLKFYSKLRDAVSSARLNDVIILCQGFHTLDETLIIKKNLEIIGNGPRDYVVIKGSIHVEECHVRLHSFTIERTKQHTEAIHCANGILDLDYCVVKSKGTSVVLSKGSNVLIKNCSIYGPSVPVVSIDWSAETIILCNNELCSFSATQSPMEVEDTEEFAAVQVGSGDQGPECTVELVARYNSIVNSRGHSIGYKAPIGIQCASQLGSLQRRFNIQYNRLENNAACTEDLCLPYLPCKVTAPTVQLEGPLTPQEVCLRDNCLPPICSQHSMTWTPLFDNLCSKLLYCNSLSNHCIIGYIKQRIKFTAPDRVLSDCELVCKLCSNPLKLLTASEVRLLFGGCNMDVIFGTSPDVFVCENGHISNVNASECTIC